MKPYATPRNEYDITVDSNGVAHIEVLVEHGAGEIWAKISCLSRLVEDITLYRAGDEIDIKSDVMTNYCAFPMFHTIADIKELIEEIEMWRAPEPDYAEICACRNEAMAYSGPLA